MDLVAVLLLGLHLLAVNLAAGLPLVCIGLAWRARRPGGEDANRLGRRLAVMALGKFAIGIALGVALFGWFAWRGRNELWSAAGRLSTAKWAFTGGELAFFLLCMAGYLWLWPWAKSASRGRRWAHHALAVMAATNLLYHFPPLFIALGGWATDPQGDAISTPMFRDRIFQADIVSLWLHHVLAAFAVAGVTTAVVARPRGDSSPNAGQRFAVLFGCRLALGVTLLQLPLGAWVLMEHPGRARLIGGDAIGTSLLMTGIALSVLLLHQLLAVSGGQIEKNLILRCGVTLFFIVMVMTATLFRTRPAAVSSDARTVYEVRRVAHAERPGSGMSAKLTIHNNR